MDNEIKYVAIPPTITFETTGNTIPSKQHTCKVTAQDEGTGLNMDELKYRWVQGEAEPLENEFLEKFTNESSIEKTTGDGEWYLWILTKDKVENVTISKEGPFVFDNTGAKVEIVYSSKNPTNKNVTATINSDEQIQEIAGWTLSSDKRVLTKEYSRNANENITIKDLVGNETQVNIEINNIDKTVPIANVGYSTKEITEEKVKVAIVANEEVQNIVDWELSTNKKILTKEYSTNTKETITVKDIAGNETQVNIEINNIKKKIALGDINRDEKIDITDLLMLKRHMVAGNKESWKLTGDSLLAGDMNQDEMIDITDMLMLKREVLNNL